MRQKLSAGAYPEEYFRQLTAERIQTKFVNGHPVCVWVLKKGKRNEALDCRVYGLAALHILNPNLDALAEEQERQRLNNIKKNNKLNPATGLVLMIGILAKVWR